MRLISLLKKYELTPDLVSLDQCFMVNPEAIRAIIRACELNKKDIVLEIGSGTGILTSKLCDYALKVYAVEKDERLFEILSDMLAKKKNVELIISDAKKVGFLDANKIISNLPYNMCDWFFEKLNNSKFELSVVTIPLKFFENQAKKYENLVCEKIKDLMPADFYPQPSIKSAIVKIKKK
ncbi:MAG: rRNA adenine N-6-methyltransferase family protein [Candidatus Nanoarchaeia archaeon]|nr:rRNA adenine N-6-methyltransferase family protein [Candidatus Nanoarchaeia archaeon]